MTPEEKQHIEQRTYGITIAQVAQLVAQRNGDCSAYAASTAKIALNRLAATVARQRFTADQIQELEAIRIYLNRIRLALTDLDAIEIPTALEAKQ